jgi:hypothetical protein
MQISFMQWLLEQNDAWVKRATHRLRDEADAEERGLDYEELDHILDQHDQELQYIPQDWAC